MNKILIYAKNNNILIIGNANDVDLISEYYSLIRDIPYPKIDFSYKIENPTKTICGMTIQKNRFHFCKRYKRHYLARLQYKKISTTDFLSAMECIDRLVKTAIK